MRYLMTVICAFSFTYGTLAAASDVPAGSVKTIKGTVSIVRQDRVVSAKSGEKIFRGDILRTGADGSLGVIFKDDAVLSLGPNSELIIDDFLFSPAEGKLSFMTRMLKGTAAYLSGIIGKLSPQSIRFETPVASVGIRGTKFLVKVEEIKERVK
jgi:hypothetical protein